MVRPYNASCVIVGLTRNLFLVMVFECVVLVSWSTTVGQRPLVSKRSPSKVVTMFGEWCDLTMSSASLWA